MLLARRQRRRPAATMRLGSLLGFALFMINAVLHWTNFHFLYAAPPHLLTVLDAAILVDVSCQPRGPGDLDRVSMWNSTSAAPSGCG